jgi:hypothetical protein
VGLDILIATEAVFSCHKGRLQAIWYAEYGASIAVLAAGYNIGSFMGKYDGVDFRHPESWSCNDQVAPLNLEGRYDGVTGHPLEMMFVKVKAKHLHQSWARAAVQYDQWMAAAPRRHVSGERVACCGSALVLPWSAARQARLPLLRPDQRTCPMGCCRQRLHQLVLRASRPRVPARAGQGKGLLQLVTLHRAQPVSSAAPSAGFDHGQ